MTSPTIRCLCLAPVLLLLVSSFSIHQDVDPIFGSMEDFELLVQEAKDRGLKIVMDFVPNHSSNEHEWFMKSEQREDPYTDYYIWKDRNESNSGEYF